MEIKTIDPVKCEGVKIYKDERQFFIDEIYPLILRHMGDGEYMLLFMAINNNDSSKVYFNVSINVSNEHDHNYLVNHPLNYNNITKNKELLEFYVESTKGIGPADLFLTDFDFKEVYSKPFYTFLASRKAGDSICEAEIILNRECFIKLNLFFIRFQHYVITAAGVFANNKLKNIKYSTVDHIKMDGSSTDLSSNVVCTHYTCGNGPETYKFNFISKKIIGKKLKYSMSSEAYAHFYSNDFVVQDVFYFDKNDSFIVLYEVRSDITDKYKETKALVLPKGIYDKTNLGNPEKIYEKEN